MCFLKLLQAWYQYGVFCMHVKCHVRAEAAFKEALSRAQQHIPAAAALVCLGLAQLQGRDATPEGPGGPAEVQERTEVLACSLKDTAAAAGSDGAAAISWALLAVFYRMQGAWCRQWGSMLHVPGTRNFEVGRRLLTCDRQGCAACIMMR
jgi:hypothetical protein